MLPVAGPPAERSEVGGPATTSSVEDLRATRTDRRPFGPPREPASRDEPVLQLDRPRRLAPPGLSPDSRQTGHAPPPARVPRSHSQVRVTPMSSESPQMRLTFESAGDTVGPLGRPELAACVTKASRLQNAAGAGRRHAVVESR
jgi:hypothetical protein